MTLPPNDVTELLSAWSNGDRGALDKLIPLVYSELHRLAARYLRRARPDHTLQATALVHEAYLRLVRQSNVQWQNRAHFSGIAANLMRNILVDYARSRHAAKRGGSQCNLRLEEAATVSGERAADLVRLDGALTRLAAIDPRQSRIVELRFFGGLKIEEIAEILGVSPITVKREWRTAKAWLGRETMKGSGKC